jgi:hypothetical protein
VEVRFLRITHQPPHQPLSQADASAPDRRVYPAIRLPDRGQAQQRVAIFVPFYSFSGSFWLANSLSHAARGAWVHSDDPLSIVFLNDTLLQCAVLLCAVFCAPCDVCVCFAV